MARLRGLISSGFLSDPIFKYIEELEEVLCSKLNLTSRKLDQDCFAPCNDYGADDCDLVFVPMARDVALFRDNWQVIPVVFDVFKEDYDDFCRDIAKFRLVYVTDLAVCRSLTARGHRQVRFLPFSVPDRHVLREVPAKDIDIIQYGRRDPELNQYMQRLLLRFPQVHYLWTEYDKQAARHYFHSNHFGMVGSSDVRANFWQVLERCKISLVSMPGYDSGREGLHTVPIRYFESAAKYCHMISRHPSRGDFLWLGVDEVAERADLYDAFEDLVRQHLAEPFSEEKQARYRGFLDKHLTSKRAWQMLSDIRAL